MHRFRWNCNKEFVYSFIGLITFFNHSMFLSNSCFNHNVVCNIYHIYLLMSNSQKQWVCYIIDIMTKNSIPHAKCIQWWIGTTSPNQSCVDVLLITSINYINQCHQYTQTTLTFCVHYNAWGEKLVMASNAWSHNLELTHFCTWARCLSFYFYGGSGSWCSFMHWGFV